MARKRFDFYECEKVREEYRDLMHSELIAERKRLLQAFECDELRVHVLDVMIAETEKDDNIFED